MEVQVRHVKRPWSEFKIRVKDPISVDINVFDELGETETHLACQLSESDAKQLHYALGHLLGEHWKLDHVAKSQDDTG